MSEDDGFGMRVDRYVPVDTEDDGSSFAAGSEEMIDFY